MQSPAISLYIYISLFVYTNSDTISFVIHLKKHVGLRTIIIMRRKIDVTCDLQEKKLE